MKSVLAGLLLLASTGTALADACTEKFVKLFADRSEKGPTKSHITQAIKGGMTSKNWHYYNGTGHWMTEMIEPADMQWTLVHGNVMYTSSDKGKSWQKVRTLDSAQNEADTLKGLQETAATVKNAACGTDEIDGVAHDTVEADYSNAKFKTEHHDKYWVNPETGWISKSETSTKQANFESFVTQIIEKAPDQKLPTPGE